MEEEEAGEEERGRRGGTGENGGYNRCEMH